MPKGISGALRPNSLYPRSLGVNYLLESHPLRINKKAPDLLRSGAFLFMRGLWDDIRTWFECHHKEYLWIDVDKSYSTSIKKMDEIESDNE